MAVYKEIKNHDRAAINRDRIQKVFEEDINKMMDKVIELESVGVRRPSNYKDYSYGFAAGIKYAIGILSGEVE